jgi:hypothetical protein
MSSSNSRCHGVHRFTLVLATVFAMFAAHVQADTRTVLAGGSIQAAINASAPGDTIVVARGTFNEQLLITKSGISLIGNSATILMPPATFATNDCSGLVYGNTEAGICIAGTGLTLGTDNIRHKSFTSVTTPVTGVTITGFTISGFSGESICIVGAKDTKVTGSTLADAGFYGLLSVGSVNTNVVGNTATSSIAGNGAYGIFLSDTATSASQAMNNKINGYYCGIFVETSGSTSQSNTIQNACVSVYVAPTIANAVVSTNKISASKPGCPVARGVWMNGAINTTVSSNIIKGQQLPDVTGRGVLIDNFATGPPASGNNVKSNVFGTNDKDLEIVPVGSNNVATSNVCSTGQTCNA